MLLPPTCIATYSTSHHRQRCQHDCLLSHRLAIRGSTMPMPCCMAHQPRTLSVFNASKMRWLDASWTRKLNGARMRCYINYTGCPSVIALTLNLLKLRSSLVLLLLACTLITSVARYLPSCTLRSQDTNLLAVHTTKTVFGSRAFRVAALTVFNSLPLDIRSTRHLCILPPCKDVLLSQCLQSTLATPSMPQIQHILLTLRA